MRHHMRVKGQAVSIRGTIQTLNPQTGAFSILFDVPLTGDNAEPRALVNFVQQSMDLVDTIWGEVWEIIS